MEEVGRVQRRQEDIWSGRGGGKEEETDGKGRGGGKGGGWKGGGGKGEGGKGGGWKAVRTSVCTMRGRLTLRWQINSYTSSVSSLAIILCSMLSSVMNVPVRPTPALQCTSRGGPSYLWDLRTRWMNWMREVLSAGTPWSGQAE